MRVLGFIDPPPRGGTRRVSTMVLTRDALLLLCLAVPAAAGLEPPAAAQGPPVSGKHMRPVPWFRGLGDLPGGGVESIPRSISPDGAFVVGSSLSANGQEAFLWTAEDGMVGLGDLAGGGFESEAKGVSTDGAVVVGYGRTAAGLEAFTWSATTGMVGLGDLAGGATFSVGTDVDAAGLTIVGYGESANGTEAFRWTGLTGMVGLGDLAGGSFASRALRMSADGQVIVGDSDSTWGALACRWVGGGAPQDLWLNGDPVVPVSGMSASMNGSVLGGAAIDGTVPVAFRWKGNVTTSLGVVPYQTLSTLGVSHDGKRAVGPGWNGQATRAWIWDDEHGVRDLREVILDEYGVRNVKGWILESASDISGDGQLVVGYGKNTKNNREAFLAFLPIPCRADLDGDGVVDLVDVGIFSAAYANGDPLADFDGNGFIDPDDQAAFGQAYVQGCD